jgi:hypothetical protein
MLSNIAEERRSHLKFVLVAVPKHFNPAVLHALCCIFVIVLTVIDLAVDVKLLVLFCLSGHRLIAQYRFLKLIVTD